MQGYQSRVNTSIRPYEGGSVSGTIVLDLVELSRKTGPVAKRPDSAAERTLFAELKSESQVCSREQQRMIETVPQASPSDTQIRHCMHSVAWTFFLSGFVSCGNKGAMILIPKLKVASSSLVARFNFL